MEETRPSSRSRIPPTPPLPSTYLSTYQATNHLVLLFFFLLRRPLLRSSGKPPSELSGPATTSPMHRGDCEQAIAGASSRPSNTGQSVRLHGALSRLADFFNTSEVKQKHDRELHIWVSLGSEGVLLSARDHFMIFSLALYVCSARV